MKAVCAWTLICSALILAALFLRGLAHPAQGALFTVLLFCVNLGLLARICKGSR